MLRIPSVLSGLAAIAIEVKIMKALFGSLAAALFLVSNVYANPPAAQSNAAPAGDQAAVQSTEKTTEKEVKADGSSTEKKVEKKEAKSKAKKSAH